MNFRALAAEFCMRRKIVTVAFCNFENVLKMYMTGNVARIASLMFVVKRLMEFRRANARLRYPPLTKKSMTVDPICIHIKAVRSCVP
jgi:hypothetical protein